MPKLSLARAAIILGTVGLGCCARAPVPPSSAPLPNMGTVVPFTATPTQTPLTTTGSTVLDTPGLPLASTPAPASPATPAR